MKAKIGAVRSLMPCPSFLFLGEKSKILVWFHRDATRYFGPDTCDEDKICFKLNLKVVVINYVHYSTPHVVKIDQTPHLTACRRRLAVPGGKLQKNRCALIREGGRPKRIGS